MVETVLEWKCINHCDNLDFATIMYRKLFHSSEFWIAQHKLKLSPKI